MSGDTWGSSSGEQLQQQYNQRMGGSYDQRSAGRVNSPPSTHTPNTPGPATGHSAPASHPATGQHPTHGTPHCRNGHGPVPRSTPAELAKARQAGAQSSYWSTRAQQARDQIGRMLHDIKEQMHKVSVGGASRGVSSARIEARLAKLRALEAEVAPFFAHRLEPFATKAMQAAGKYGLRAGVRTGTGLLSGPAAPFIEAGMQAYNVYDGVSTIAAISAEAIPLMSQVSQYALRFAYLCGPL